MKIVSSIGFVISILISSFTLADVAVQLDVTYSDCTIVDGPLSLGLNELPDEVNAQFVYLSPSFPPSTNPEGLEPEVLSASLTLGDAQMTANDLDGPLSLRFQPRIEGSGNPILDALSWRANVASDATEMGLETLNSIIELTVRGTDAASGQAFEYNCPRTAAEMAAVEPVPVRLDVTYSQCEVVDGPLSLGLFVLPDVVQAQFEFLSPSFPPPTNVEGFEVNALTASLSIGDAQMTAFDLNEPVSMRFAQDIDSEVAFLDALSWNANVASDTTEMGLGTLNSIIELTLRGTDAATGEAFEYNCPRTEAELVPVTPQPVQLDVTYSQCSIVDGQGPAPLGLPELPDAVQAQFVLLSPSFPLPATPDAFAPAVLSASLTFGDTQITTEDLNTPLSLQLAPNVNTGIAELIGLSWTANVASDATEMGIDTLNNIAELTLRGVYADTGQAFEYNCPRTDATLSPPGSKQIAIDIRPLSKRNNINIRWQRFIPVAVLSDDSFDARQVKPSTVRFGPDGARALRLRLHPFDVDYDGDKDRVFIFKVPKTGIACGDTAATLTGETFAGDQFMGTDRIRVKGCRW